LGGIFFAQRRIKSVNSAGRRLLKGMENGNKSKEFVRFQINRKVTNLYKQFLFMLEDLDGDGYDIPDEVFQKLRKRVLDYGNDAIREIEENLDNFDIELKL
jgi:hypothetical protein